MSYTKEDTEELFGYLAQSILSLILIVAFLIFCGPYLLQWCETNTFIAMLFVFAGMLGLEGYLENKK
jgi:hypothetical protein